MSKTQEIIELRHKFEEALFYVIGSGGSTSNEILIASETLDGIPFHQQGSNISNSSLLTYRSKVTRHIKDGFGENYFSFTDFDLLKAPERWPTIEDGNILDKQGLSGCIESILRNPDDFRRIIPRDQRDALWFSIIHGHEGETAAQILDISVPTLMTKRRLALSNLSTWFSKIGYSEEDVKLAILEIRQNAKEESEVRFRAPLDDYIKTKLKSGSIESALKNIFSNHRHILEDCLYRSAVNFGIDYYLEGKSRDDIEVKYGVKRPQVSNALLEFEEMIFCLFNKYGIGKPELFRALYAVRTEAQVPNSIHSAWLDARKSKDSGIIVIRSKLNSDEFPENAKEVQIKHSPGTLPIIVAVTDSGESFLRFKSRWELIPDTIPNPKARARMERITFYRLCIECGASNARFDMDSFLQSAELNPSRAINIIRNISPVCWNSRDPFEQLEYLGLAILIDSEGLSKIVKCLREGVKSRVADKVVIDELDYQWGREEKRPYSHELNNLLIVDPRKIIEIAHKIFNKLNDTKLKERFARLPLVTEASKRFRFQNQYGTIDMNLIENPKIGFTSYELLTTISSPDGIKEIINEANKRPSFWREVFADFDLLKYLCFLSQVEKDKLLKRKSDKSDLSNQIENIIGPKLNDYCDNLSQEYRKRFEIRYLQ